VQATNIDLDDINITQKSEKQIHDKDNTDLHDKQ
jgi:hypothetical protein